MSKKLKSRQSDQRTYDPDITYTEDLSQNSDYNPWEENENGEPVIYWDTINESSITDLGGKGVRNRYQAKRLAREDFVNGVQDRKVRYVGNPRTSYGVQQPGDKYPSYEVKNMTPIMQKAYDKAYNKAKVQWLDQEEKKQHNLDLLNTMRKGGAEGTSALQDYTREHTNESAEYMANRLGWLPGMQWMFIPSVFNSIGQMRSDGMTGPGWTALQAGMGLASVLPVGELFSGVASRWGSVVGGKLGTLARLESEGNRFIPNFNFNRSLYKAMGNTPLARKSATLMAKNNVQLASEALNTANKELNALKIKYDLANVSRSTLPAEAQKAITDAESAVAARTQDLGMALRNQTVAGNYFPTPRKRGLSELQNTSYKILDYKDWTQSSPLYKSQTQKLNDLIQDKGELEQLISETYDRYQRDLKTWEDAMQFVKAHPEARTDESYRLKLRKPQLSDYMVGENIITTIPLSKLTEEAFNKSVARGVDYGSTLKNFGLSFDENGKLVWTNYGNPSLTLTKGDAQIPIFGTLNRETGTFDRVNVSVTLNNKASRGDAARFPVSEMAAKHRKQGYVEIPNTVDVLFSEEGSVSPELKNVIQHNIEEVRKELGGGDIIGTTSIAGDVPHLPHDMDWITTDELLAKNGITGYDLNNRDMFVWHMGAGTQHPSPYGSFGNVEVNVIRTGADGKAEGYIAEELFRQFYPEEYSKAILDAWSNGSRHPKIPYTPEQLLETYHDNIGVKQVMDVLESGKGKHAARAFGYLMHLDPDLMSEGIDKFAKEMMGENIIKAPKFPFTDVEENARILKEIGIPYDITGDPKRMQNAFDIWFYESLRNYRGINETFLGNRDKIVELLDVNPGNYDWEGIWSVTRGHSHFGPIARRKQIVVPNIEQAKTPEEVIRMVDHSLGHFPLTEEECAIMNNPKLKPGMTGDQIQRLMTDAASQNEIYADLQKVGIQGFESGSYTPGAPLFRAGNNLPGSSVYVESFVEPMPISQRREAVFGAQNAQRFPHKNFNVFADDYTIGLNFFDIYPDRQMLYGPYKEMIYMRSVPFHSYFKYGSKNQQKTLNNIDRAIDKTKILAEEQNKFRQQRLDALQTYYDKMNKLSEKAHFKGSVRGTLSALPVVMGKGILGTAGVLGGLYGIGTGVVAANTAHQWNWLKKNYGLDKATLESVLPEYNRIFYRNETDPSMLARRLYRELQIGNTRTLEKLGLTNNIPTQKSGGALTSRYGFPILR